MRWFVFSNPYLIMFRSTNSSCFVNFTNVPIHLCVDLRTEAFKMKGERGVSFGLETLRFKDFNIKFKRSQRAVKRKDRSLIIKLIKRGCYLP